MKTKYLSQEERERGLKYFFRWAAFNGLGFSFLSDTIIYLMAIHFGARRIFLEGFDYEQPMGKPHVDVETKLLKLKYARQLIDYAARQYRIEIVQGR